MEFWILVPVSLSLLCILLPLYQWQEIGRPRLYSSPLRLGVSIQFPSLKTESKHADTEGDEQREGRTQSPCRSFARVKGQGVSVNKEGLIIYCKTGHANPHLCVFPSSSYLSLIIALPAEGQGG